MRKADCFYLVTTAHLLLSFQQVRLDGAFLSATL